MSTANRSRKITTKRNSPEVCFCMTFLSSKTSDRQLAWSLIGQGTLYAPFRQGFGHDQLGLGLELESQNRAEVPFRGTGRVRSNHW